MPASIPSVRELLTSLVQCPSVNCHGTPGPHTGDEAIVALLSDLLQPWAKEIQVREVAPGCRNLIARFAGIDASRSHAFEAHSDTVGIDGMTIDPFAAEVRDGRLFGRGACDTKGPMTAMLLALLQHLREHGQLATTFYFISTCDEELGGMGARALMTEGFRCDGIVVGEPTSLRPIDRHKGAVRYRATFQGKAAHSSYPELGANAIHAAAAFVQSLEQGISALAGTAEWPDPGGPTLSVGTIRGGDQVNRVPDLAVMEVDIRVPPGLELTSVARLLSSAQREVESDRSGITISCDRTQEYPPFQLAADHPFRQTLGPLEKEDAPGFDSVRYATNAGFFSSANVPCIVFGPGSIADAHTADESVELAEVEQGVAILRRYLKAF